MMDDRKRHREIWRETKPMQCPRCKAWDNMGLSSSCPSCDAVHIEAYETKIKAEGLEV